GLLVEVVGDSRGVRHQMPHLDGPGAVDPVHHVEAVDRLRGEMSCDPVIEGEPPFGFELQDHGGHEQLRDAGGKEPRRHVQVAGGTRERRVAPPYSHHESVDVPLPGCVCDDLVEQALRQTSGHVRLPPSRRSRQRCRYVSKGPRRVEGRFSSRLLLPRGGPAGQRAPGEDERAAQERLPAVRRPWLLRPDMLLRPAQGTPTPTLADTCGTRSPALTRAGPSNPSGAGGYPALGGAGGGTRCPRGWFGEGPPSRSPRQHPKPARLDPWRPRA